MGLYVAQRRSDEMTPDGVHVEYSIPYATAAREAGKWHLGVEKDSKEFEEA